MISPSLVPGLLVAAYSTQQGIVTHAAFAALGLGAAKNPQLRAELA
ncbi:hypothetical protein [Arthrobacter psychrochitiniphilus]|nr:hypothetical protein [Arthrobacter psychrochitiniphilus]NYG18773.1 hypothetical protein [Arthrobacter psychrochitiniphilus]